MANEWKIVNHRTLLDDGVVRVDKRLYKSEYGYGEFDVVRSPDFVIVLALTLSNEVILVEQFRPGVNSWTTEFPGGKCEAREDALDAAKRELSEETGFSSEDWTHLLTSSPNPALQDNLLHVFLAQDCVPGVQDLDKDEHLRVLAVPFREVPSMFRDGAFGSVACHAVFLAYLLHLSGDKIL